MQIFRLAVNIVFHYRSFYMQMNLYQDTLPFGKDTFYSFMNSCHTNWRKFTTLLVSSIIRRSIEPLTDEKRRNVLIIDDSIFSRSRSKKVELLAKIFDHAHGLYTYRKSQDYERAELILCVFRVISGLPLSINF